MRCATANMFCSLESNLEQLLPKQSRNAFEKEQQEFRDISNHHGKALWL